MSLTERLMVYGVLGFLVWWHLDLRATQKDPVSEHVIKAELREELRGEIAVARDEAGKLASNELYERLAVLVASQAEAEADAVSGIPVPLEAKEPRRRHITASVLSTSRPFPGMIKSTIEVTNHSDLTLGSVGIRVDAYDGAKRHLASSTATVRNLGPGETKRTDDLLVNAPGRVRLALALDNVHDPNYRDLTLDFTLGDPAPRSSIRTFQPTQRPTARATRSTAQRDWIDAAIAAVRSKDGGKHLNFPKDLNSTEYAIDLIEGVGVSTATVSGYFERRNAKIPWAVQLRVSDTGAEVKHVRIGE